MAACSASSVEDCPDDHAVDSESLLFENLDIFDSVPKSRSTCDRCKRPITVCWCPFLPRERLHIETTVYILQHPFEESRCLKTVPMLEHSLAEGKCHVIKGKRFGPKRCPELVPVLASPSTLLLYPGPGAVDLATLVGGNREDGHHGNREDDHHCNREDGHHDNGKDGHHGNDGKGNPDSLNGNRGSPPGLHHDNCSEANLGGVHGNYRDGDGHHGNKEYGPDVGHKVKGSSRPCGPYTLVLLDGTWPQARGLLAHNPCLHHLTKVKITSGRRSKYVIRTQPCDEALSTLETAALALAIIEGRPNLADTLVAPLDALCNFQLRHGAVTHQSKQWKMEHGTWDKPLSKRDRNRLARRDAGDKVDNTHS